MATLLYVDDEETIGRAVARWFGRRGHTVLVAPTVEAARALLVEHHPDILFIDVWLGGESGFDLMHWIQDNRPELAERVTFVTGELAEGTADSQPRRTNGRPVLQKPFDFAMLEQHVELALGNSGGVERHRPDAERRSGT